MTHEERPSIVVLGDLCLDMVVEQRLPFSLRNDSFSEEPAAWVRMGERLGGSAYHVARSAREQELDAILVGCIGKDVAGDLISGALVRDGVRVKLERSAASPTARVFIAHDTDGMRVMIASSESANDDLSPEFLKESYSTFGRADLLWLSGLCLRNRETVRARTIRTALELSRDADTPVILDLVPHDFRRYFASIGEVESEYGSIDGVSAELGSARRLLGMGSPGEALTERELVDTADRLLETTTLAVLRLNDGKSYTQIARSRDGFDGRWVHPAPDEMSIRGYGDSMACEALSAYILARTVQSPSQGC